MDQNRNRCYRFVINEVVNDSYGKQKAKPLLFSSNPLD